MNGTGAAKGTQAVSATTRRRAVNFTLWALQALLALQFATAGFVKVIGDPTMVEMSGTFSHADTPDLPCSDLRRLP